MWVNTEGMAGLLGIHYKTLAKLKARGYFNEGQHYRKANPLAKRSNLLWHTHRVLLRMNAV